MPKKGQQEKIIFCTLNKGQLPTLLIKKKVLHFTLPLKSARFLRELGNETYTFYHLYTSKFKKA